MTCTTQVSAAVPPPWYAAYPGSKTEILSITRDIVLEMLGNGRNVAGKDLILIISAWPTTRYVLLYNCPRIGLNIITY